MNQITRESASNPRRGFATSNGDRATALINASGIDRSLLAKLPVNVNEIARSLGAKAIRQVDLPVDGLMLPIADGFEILLNKRHLITRQRFSCAHEIAHALIDPGNPACRGKGTRSNSRERSCENLASILLMPNPAFRDLATATRPSIAAVEYLCRTFMTSVQSTAIRFIDEIKEACVLIVSSKLTRSSSSPTVRWANHNIPKPERGARLFIRPGTPLAIKTAMAACYESGVQRGWDVIQVGDLRCKSYVESKSFGQGESKYLLSLIFPERTPARHPI